MDSDTLIKREIKKYLIWLKLINILNFVVLMSLAALPLWFIGGRTVILDLKAGLENMPVFSNDMGIKYMKIGKYAEAADQFESAVWSEKYIVFWNDDTELPNYYQNLGKAYMNLSKPEKAAKEFDNYRLELEKRFPEKEFDIAFASFQAGVQYLRTGDNENAKDHMLSAAQYFDKRLEEEQDQDYGKVNIFLGYCYFKEGVYEKAIERFVKGIPAYYNNIDWGIGDKGDTIFISIAYRFLSKAYGYLKDIAKETKFIKKYEDIVYFRDISDKEVEEFMTGFGLNFE